MLYMSLFLSSLGFLLIHFVSATNIRENFIAKYGANVWMSTFSVISLAFFTWMVVEYMIADAVEPLWVMPNWWLWINAVLMFVALFLILLGNIPDKDARLGKGVFAITRHPTNWGLALFSATHMITAASVVALLFWGSILGTGIIGSYFLDKRKIATGSERWKNAPKNSSWLPFLAIIQGKTQLNFDDFKPMPVMVSVAVFFVAAIVHVGVFGTYLLPL